MQKIENIVGKYYLILIILFSLPAVISLFVPGFYGASDDMHIAWLYEMNAAIRAGQFPPRFVPNLSYNFGYPLFNFVFPLPFYFGEIIHILGFSYVDSIKIIFLLSIPISAFTMYALIRKFSNNLTSLTGAILYIYTPYRATDIYIRGAIGEIVAFVFMPLVVLALVNIIKDFRKKWVGVGSLSLAALILSHNISAYIFVPATLILILIYFIAFKFHKFTIRLKYLMAMYFLSLTTTIYFWFPAIRDSRLMKPETVFNYYDHFPTLKQLFYPFFGYGASVAGPYDGIALSFGLVNWAILILGVVIFLLNYKKLDIKVKGLIIWSILILIVSVFMMNHRSSMLWEILPFIKQFQFPWRFLIVVTLVTPLFVVVLGMLKKSVVYLIVLILVSILASYSYFKPHDFLGRGDDYYINRYIPNPTSLEYKSVSEEYLRLPINNEKRPDSNMPLFYSDKNLTYRVIKHDGINTVANITTEDDIIVNYSKYNFPGWKVYVNGMPRNILTGKPFGQVGFLLNRGDHRIEIYFKETPINIVFDLMSLVGLLTSLYLVGINDKIVRNLKLKLTRR